MIMKDKPNSTINPFSKITTLRGFNNTPDNIQNQMKTAKDPYQSPKQRIENQKTNYDPQKQRNIINKLNQLKKQ